MNRLLRQRTFIRTACTLLGVGLFAGGSVVIAAPDDGGDAEGQQRSAGSSATFVSVAPTRVLDTRTTSGGDGPVAAGDSVTATLIGLPADAAAAVVNVTAANATGNGYLTVWDCDGPAPGTSNSNFVGINTVAANVITAIGDDSTICVQAGDASTQIIVDQMGYFPVGSGIETITPSRVLDTRTTSGGTGPVTLDTTTTITLDNLPTDAAAAIVNITTTGARADGYFTAWNCDGDAPNTSNGNYVGVSTIANSAIVELGDNNEICVTTGDAEADLIVDVFGYFIRDSGYTPVTPTRALDTRTTSGGTGPVQPGVPTKINLGDVPAGDAAIVNITATGATGDGYFTAWNCDGPAPDTSNGNYVGVTTIANSAIVTTNVDGDICIQTGQSGTDILIDTYAYVGAEFWPVSVSATTSVTGNGTTLADGSVIVTGSYSGTATFAPTVGGTPLTLSATGGTDIYVAKLDSRGRYLWVASAGGSNDDRGVDVSGLNDGSAIVAGYFRTTAMFPAADGGSLELETLGLNDLFVAKIGSDGVWQWATRAGGPGHQNGSAVAVLPDGGALIAGETRPGEGVTGEIEFEIGGETVKITNSKGTDGFVAKIDDDGNWVWARQIGNSELDNEGVSLPNGLSVADDGTAIVTGNFDYTAKFPIGPDEDLEVTSAGDLDAFVAKIDGAGDWQWVTRVGWEGRDRGNDVAATSGGVFFVGSLQDNVTIPAVDTAGGSDIVLSGTRGNNDIVVGFLNTAGKWVWATRVAGLGNDLGLAIATTSDGSGAIVTGEFEDTVTVPASPAIELTSSGESDIFIAEIDDEGVWQWATSAGGTGADEGQSVFVLSGRSAIVVGDFTGSANFGGCELTAAAGTGAFVVKVDGDGEFINRDCSGDV